MAEMVTVRPATGRRVRHPVTRQIMTREATLPRDSWMERRIADGDLVPDAAPPEAPAAPAPAKKK